MIDPSMAAALTPYPLTPLEEKVADLEKQLQQKTQNWEFVRQELTKVRDQINSFEGALKNNEWDFDYETLSDLASYFDIELSREYDVTITVRWSGTVTAPMHFDMDDIENFLDIRIDTDYRTSDAIIDLYQDDFEIDYNEVG